MTRLFLDQGLPRSAVNELRAAGWDVVHAADVGMSRATDAEILAFANSAGRTCVTLDADFHAILATRAMSSPSVVRLRLEGMNGKAVADLLLRIWPRVSTDLVAGAMVTVNEQSIRVRRLPLGEFLPPP